MSTDLCPHCGELFPDGGWPLCQDSSGRHGHGMPHGGSLLTAYHPSERTVIYRNPRTGEHRTPARNDQPIPEVYARQGYVREELDTPAAKTRFEKETGLLHEATHYHKGSGNAEKALTADPEPYKRDPAITKRLVEALR